MSGVVWGWGWERALTLVVRYGGIEEYVMGQLGFTKEEVEGMKRNLKGSGK